MALRPRRVACRLDDPPADARWLQVVADLDRRTDAEIARAPATSANETYRYWRVGFADGSRVELGASLDNIHGSLPFFQDSLDK